MLNAEKVEAQADVNLEGKRILLIDDSPDNQQIIAYQLMRKGAILEAALDGNEGVVAAMKRDFDIVLMDIHMPILDGWSATRMLRDLGYDKPILAFTAHAHPEVRERCLHSGCNGVITKPVSSDALARIIAEALV